MDQRTVEALERIRDIGPKSARKIKDLAAEFARIRSDDLRPPGNPDTWKGRGLRSWSAVWRCCALVTALAPHAAVLQQALGAVRVACARHQLAGVAVQPGVTQGPGPV